ncbi:MAG: hypothetical protein EOP04_14335 [Proteobacteria bacterium]|nr:MAG: hypothetical protein EOP04_14335 [Pseudomonadota bacterium]
MTTSQYIDSFRFISISTFSFQRGEEYLRLNLEMKKRLQSLNVRRYKKNDLSEVQDNEFQDLSTRLGTTSYLTDSDGSFHESARKISGDVINGDISNRLVEILRTSVVNLANWMCAPVYRDAVVFYDVDYKIVSVLNVCFSCEALSLENGQLLEADITVFPMLRDLFMSLGHELHIDE